ncbi:Gfo/Idh/MocA family protein [Crateriforma conspicua]|uniref:1,5-anhydro-D-fructose reductase n=1 Tax=Crateriforma conspicua TaxID=2527996 RepID=A0A5C5Y625_9PLAN|nr:Gfo/Idh/MocA family oxidoreductase [Crateriforma conspicua]TWT68912.1 1,5-anhydro-D-fructose reductase [Crateriforma conspicua]
MRAVVVGSGFIGPVHVEALLRAGQDVLGIVASSPQKTTQACEALGLRQVYDSYEAVLADPHVDVVHITTPNRLHYDMAKSAIAAGKHVMCEKPLAMDSRQSAELVHLAEQSDVVTGVNYNIRYYPLCREAERRNADGELGNVHHVTGGYVQDWLFHPTDFNWRVLSSEGGPLRAVADIGTHWLDLIHFITKTPVRSVCADLQTVYPVRRRPTGNVETYSGSSSQPQSTQPIDIDTEDAGSILVRFEGGAHGCMTVSQVTAGRKNCCRFEMAGSRQTLAWNSESPNEMFVGHRDRPNETLLRDPALVGGSVSEGISYPGGHNEGFPDTFKHCFIDFYRAIEAKQNGEAAPTPGHPSFADGHREVVLCEAILKSHHERRWIDIGESGIPS